jgi:DNA-directed RNA polymerase alpha subunit
MNMPFSEECLLAISMAVKNQEPVVDLEFIGVKSRTLSILQKNGINTMDQLMHCTKKQLQEIKSIGENSVSQIIQCLANYHEISKKCEEEMGKCNLRKTKKQLNKKS